MSSKIFDNLEKINVGDRYKNFKDFCLKIGINPPKCTDSKKALEKELQSYFKIKYLDSREFIIKEKYETKKVEYKPISKNNKNNKYSYELETLLMQKNLIRYESISTIMCNLGIINYDFIKFKYDYKFYIENFTTDYFSKNGYLEWNSESDVNTLVIGTYTNIFKHSMFMGAVIKEKLNKLHKNGVIDLKKKRKIKIGNFAPTITTKEQDKQIEVAEDNALKEMGLENKNEIAKQYRFAEFNKIVLENLKKEIEDIRYYYDVYSYKILVKKKGRKFTKEKLNELSNILRDRYIETIKEKLVKDTKSLDIIRKSTNKTIYGHSNDDILKIELDILKLITNDCIL